MQNPFAANGFCPDEHTYAWKWYSTGIFFPLLAITSSRREWFPHTHTLMVSIAIRTRAKRNKTRDHMLNTASHANDAIGPQPLLAFFHSIFSTSSHLFGTSCFDCGGIAVVDQQRPQQQQKTRNSMLPFVSAVYMRYVQPRIPAPNKERGIRREQ